VGLSPPSIHSTPISFSSDQHKDSRTQDTLKTLSRHELSGATWQSNELVTMYFPAESAHVNKVLREVPVPSNPLASQHEPERKFYRPFTSLLNRICSSFRGINSRTKGIYENMQFFPYDRLMKEGVGGSPLKPDCLGCCPLPRSTKEVSWKEVELVIEIKDEWPALISQGATYARALFATRGSRQFAIVITFNHRDGCVRFCIFHRCGLYSTKPLKLVDNSDFTIFASIIVGILSWSSRLPAGMEMSRNNMSFYIPSLGIYRIANTYCNRQVVRGRATCVFLLQRSRPDTQAKAVDGRGNGKIERATADSSGSGGEMDQFQGEVAKNNTKSPFPLSQQCHEYRLRCRTGTASRPFILDIDGRGY
jgi:hypothetical protein